MPESSKHESSNLTALLTEYLDMTDVEMQELRLRQKTGELTQAQQIAMLQVLAARTPDNVGFRRFQEIVKLIESHTLVISFEDENADT